MRSELEGCRKSEGKVKSWWLFRMEICLSVLLFSGEVLLLGEEPVFSVLLSSATPGKRPPVLSREEINERE